jgi:hypothetical protein
MPSASITTTAETLRFSLINLAILIVDSIVKVGTFSRTFGDANTRLSTLITLKSWIRTILLREQV